MGITPSTTTNHLHKNFSQSFLIAQNSISTRFQELLSTNHLHKNFSQPIIFIYTFVDPLETVSQQDFKKLLSLLKSPENNLLDDDEIQSALISMISANLFRPLPPCPNASTTPVDSPDDEEPMAVPVPSWPHLQVVYCILLRLVINADPKTLRNHMDHSFLVNLLLLFQSEDPRERETLKNVYHRIYSEFTFYRSNMRKSMINVFLHYVCEMETQCGIGELLETWGSIINGFAVPIKEEHKLFLVKVLIPLHKPKGIQTYHRQLAYCVSQFIQKETILGETVVRGTLKYWPVTNCQKEVLLIGQLEELVENIDPGECKKLAKPLCAQFAKCLNSCNSQVAERALYLWKRCFLKWCYALK